MEIFYNAMNYFYFMIVFEFDKLYLNSLILISFISIIFLYP